MQKRVIYLVAALAIALSAFGSLHAAEGTEKTTTAATPTVPKAAAMPVAPKIAAIPFELKPLHLAVAVFAHHDGTTAPGSDSLVAFGKALTARGALVADATKVQSLQAAKPAELKTGALPADINSDVADYVVVMDCSTKVGAKNVRGTDKNSYGVDIVTTILHTDSATAINALTLKGGGVFATPAEAAADALGKRVEEAANYVATIINQQRTKDFQIKLHISEVQDTDHRDDLLDILSFPKAIREVRFQKLGTPAEISDVLLTVQGISAGEVGRILSGHGYGLTVNKVGKGELWTTYTPSKAFAIKLFSTAFGNSTRDDGYEVAAEKLGKAIGDTFDALPWIWTGEWPEGQPDFPKKRVLKRLLKNTKEDFGMVLVSTGELKIHRDIMKLCIKVYAVPSARPLLNVTLEGDFTRPESYTAQMQEKVLQPLRSKLKKIRKKFSKRRQDELHILLEQ